MANPLVSQGTLNRVRTSVIVPAFTALNITAPYMGKSFARLAFEGDFTDQTPTGTGLVNSPAPYVAATITVGILRTQALASAWRAQWESNSVLGQVKTNSDSKTFDAVTLYDTSIRHFDPNAWDGMDAVCMLVLRGTYYLNNDLWSMA
ncbi:hypothetical protein KDX27_14800 [Burkholderia cenocepacia]|jgi:hypothetical protein|uniref:hypothetical protein n=1 Tax=Burkholderia cenocepacia TaxID=95486 RepID=UPI001BA15A7E|nr:hypothetical protein [Burkholderia cenocepacia]MBR8168986.1 hypothetical protein [Burkholderia cenocepacia]MBR8425034.1 hypothetical protein [Burkholderia cenocepacia]MDN7658442.1 hypothetical protein [Burkholderia cenocepacia]